LAGRLKLVSAFNAMIWERGLDYAWRAAQSIGAAAIGTVYHRPVASFSCRPIFGFYCR
jgi:hypothetical protein